MDSEMPKNAYPGTISSVMLSVLVVILLLVPFYIANHLDKVRRGEAKYEFKEVMFFDINSKDDFKEGSGEDNWLWVSKPYDVWGSGEFVWGHRRYINGGCINEILYHPVVMLDVPLDGVIDEYATSQCVLRTGHRWCSWYSPYSDRFAFLFSFTKSFLVENDLTRIDFYFNTSRDLWQGRKIVGGLAYFRGENVWWSTIISTEFNLGVLTQMEVSVQKLLLIQSLNEGYQIFFIIDGEKYPQLDAENLMVYFDMQFYHIKEFKITTIDWIGIAMTGTGIFMGFCSIIMLPHVEFSRVIGKIVGKGGK